MVQGVGFRPFVYRIATNLGINGTIENRTDGVVIEINGDDLVVKTFVDNIKQQAPPASAIDLVQIEMIDKYICFENFKIVKSTNISNAVTEISPDIAVCNDCLNDMKLQAHRIAYPFINCTNCGPRFSIIQNLPYDRDKTTMKSFVMCKTCRSEYTHVADRRFHAQPVACNQCGPKYTLHYNGTTEENHSHMLHRASELLNGGKILAIKGMGGYFIACDAANQAAVELLRQRKKRDAKPLAVMFRDWDTLQKYTETTEAEKELITSWRRPIVLVKQTSPLAPSVNYQLNKLGAFLPYMPFHYQLFQSSGLDALVMTSGNISNEPIIINDSLALQKLGNIADAVITYNREIYNRCDDSVAFVSKGKTQLIRRSRGYVPTQIALNFDADGILATGAELKNTFCLGKNNRAIISQHIGDLKNAETLNFFVESVQRFKKLFRCKPHTLVSDLHPDYLSTKFARESGLQHIMVQHHHAHIASVMAETGVNQKVIGVSLDGLGLGTDGALWGGEFLVCNFQGFERPSHFDYVPMPGADKASTEPWRMGVAYLYHYLGKDFLNLNIPFVKNLDLRKTKLLIQAMDAGINSPLTSSCGRLFDAVAAICGICNKQAYEAQAAMLFEGLAEENCEEVYSYNLQHTLSFELTIKEIIHDIEHQIPVSRIAARFHNTLAHGIAQTVAQISSQTHIKTVALSGGCFQNQYLLQKTVEMLSRKQLTVLLHEKVPANDGGLSLGQLAIAAHGFMSNEK